MAEKNPRRASPALTSSSSLDLAGRNRYDRNMRKNKLIAVGTIGGALLSLLFTSKTRIIDANTGKEVQIGGTFRNVDGEVTIHEVEIGLFSGRALVSIDGSATVWMTPEGEIPNPHPVNVDRKWGALAIRYTHPSYFLQKVAFIPS